MIDVKIIKRPKGSTSATSSSGGLVTAHTSYSETSVKEAAHAKKADEATHATSAYELDADSPTREDFLSATDDDTAAGLIEFLKGITVDDATRLLSTLSVKGAATFQSLIKAQGGITLDETMQSSLFDELAETGFGLVKDEGGGWSLFLKNITVWGKAIFRELEIRRLSYVGGDFVFSPSGCTIDSVTAIDADGNELTAEATDIYAYRCYYIADDGTTATMNSFMEDDQARCETFNIKSGVYENVSNRAYWRRVVAVGDGYVDLSATDYDETLSNDTPQKGDVLVVMGNRTNTDRQNIIKITTEGTSAPAIEMYHGVYNYHLGKWTDANGVVYDNRTAIVSPKLVEIDADMFHLTSGGNSQTISDYIDGIGKQYTHYAWANRIDLTEPELNKDWVKDDPQGQQWKYQGIAQNETESSDTLNYSDYKWMQLAQGKDGKDGEDGKDGVGQAGEDAISMRVIGGSTAFAAVEVGDTVTLDSSSVPWMNVKTQTDTLTVAMYKGTTRLTSGVTYTVASDDILNIGGSTSSGLRTLILTTSSKVKAEKWTSDDGEKTLYFPKTDAAIEVKATYGGQSYALSLPVSIDYTARWSNLITTNEQWRTEINRIQSNLNLLDDIPMNKISDTVVGITDDEVTELFLNKTLYPTTATATTAAPYFKANTVADEGIRVTTFKWYKAAQYLVFRRKYADHVTDYPKAGNVLYLTMRYRTSGACRIFCGMNAINTATSEQYDHWKNIDESPYTETTTTNSDGTTTTTKHYQWQTVTLKVDTSKLTGAATDRLYIRLYARSADSSFSIYNMTLLREGGQLVQTMGYVDVKADEVTLGVKNDLSDTGIDITAHQIKAKADNFVVVNNDGEETLAVNSKGELKAGSVVSENDEQKIELTGGMLSAMTDDTDGKTGFSFTTLNSSPVLAYYGNGIMKWYLCEEGIKYIVTGGIELVAKSSKATTKASATTSNGMTTVKVYYTATVMIKNTGSSSIKISSLSIRAGRQYSNGTLEGKYSSTITLSAGGTASYTITTDTETKTFSGTSYPVPNYGNLIEVLCDSTLLGTIEADKASA